MITSQQYFKSYIYFTKGDINSSVAKWFMLLIHCYLFNAVAKNCCTEPRKINGMLMVFVTILLMRPG